MRACADSWLGKKRRGSVEFSARSRDIIRGRGAARAAVIILIIYIPYPSECFAPRLCMYVPYRSVYFMKFFEYFASALVILISGKDK